MICLNLSLKTGLFHVVSSHYKWKYQPQVKWLRVVSSHFSSCFNLSTHYKLPSEPPKWRLRRLQRQRRPLRLRRRWAELPAGTRKLRRKLRSYGYPMVSMFPTWRLIPLSKWVITPVINGISRVNPLIIGVITHLLSGMSHQVVLICTVRMWSGKMWWDYPPHDEWDYNPTKNPIDQRERNLSYRIYFNLFGIVGIFGIMWVKPCHQPPMTGNGLYNFIYTSHKNGDEWGMVYGIVLPTLPICTNVEW